MCRLLIFISLLFSGNICFCQQSLLDQERLRLAQKNIIALLKDTSQFVPHGTLKDSTAAIELAKKILFKERNKRSNSTFNIKEVHQIQSCWYLYGKMSTYKKGGTFEFIATAADGRVLKVTRFK